jgi:chorismate-pyruvate lyase
MNFPTQNIDRRVFHDGIAGPEEIARADQFLDVFLAQDGSTTRTCEAIAGVPPTIRVLRQTQTAEVPRIVRDLLPGATYLERFSSMVARGETMMDNLVYGIWDALPEAMRRDLASATVPIGRMLDELWVRRIALPASSSVELWERLWDSVGMPDARASRAYTVESPQGVLLVIAETFRAGMRMKPLALTGTPSGSRCLSR